MAYITIGAALRVLYGFKKEAGCDSAWTVLERKFGRADMRRMASPSHVADAKSWPGSCTEDSYCACAWDDVKSLSRKGRSNADICNIVSDILKRHDELTDECRTLIDDIRHEAPAQGAGDQEARYKKLFSHIYQEAEKNLGRAYPDARASATGAKVPSALPKSLSADALAQMLGGGPGGPAVSACWGMDGAALAERLLPRTLYLRYRDRLGTLAAGTSAELGRSLARDLAADGGACLGELVDRASGLVAPRDLPALCGIEARVLDALGEAGPERPEPAGLRRLLDGYADDSAPRLLAVLFVLAATGGAGLVATLSGAEARARAGMP